MNRLHLHRLVLWGILLLFALWFLAPLYVMVVTSLKDAEQVRSGTLLSLPTAPPCRPGPRPGAAPARAWSATACNPISGTRC